MKRAITEIGTIEKPSKKRTRVKQTRPSPMKGQQNLLKYFVASVSSQLTSFNSSLEHSIRQHANNKWIEVLKSEFNKPYFLQLSNFIEEQRSNETVYPDPDNTFTWIKACDFDKVKVVIIGQDPYHNPNQAHGLCFSVRPGCPQPPSLINIFRELKSDMQVETPKHGCLLGWARQGVLLLNSCLTVVKNKPNSHKGKGWELFTDHVIKSLSNLLPTIVFLLWGMDAQKKSYLVKNNHNHFILQSTHPSPLSAHRGFLGCKHFSKTNTILSKAGMTDIDWSHLPSE